MGGCERGSCKEGGTAGGGGRIGRCLPAAMGKGCDAPPPCTQLWEGSDFLNNLAGALEPLVDTCVQTLWSGDLKRSSLVFLWLCLPQIFLINSLESQDGSTQ